MFVETKHFGTIEAEESDILDFVNGLPGFDEMRKYVLINSVEGESPFKWLQSIEESQLAFAVVDPFIIKKDYHFEIDAETEKNLGIEKAEDVATLSIIVIPEDPKRMTMNLRAPLIINIKNKKAQQIILDTDKYTVRHYILDELRRQEADTDAGVDKKERSDNSHK